MRAANEEERMNAALALAWLGTPAALELLNRELKSKRDVVRKAVESALDTVRSAALKSGARRGELNPAAQPDASGSPNGEDQ